MKKENKEFIYIMSNPEFNGKTKIGRSNKMPHIRAEQLTKQTASIGEFKVEWFKEVEDSVFIEKYLHYLLKDFHYQKEYFYLTPPFAQEVAEFAIEELNQTEIGLQSIYKSQLQEIDDVIDILKELMEENGNNEIDRKEWESTIDEFEKFKIKLNQVKNC